MTLSTSAVAVCCCRRFAQIVGALAQFFEKSRILDRDDGLLREVADEFDLLIGERLNFLAINGDSANKIIVP